MVPFQSKGFTKLSRALPHGVLHANQRPATVATRLLEQGFTAQLQPVMLLVLPPLNSGAPTTAAVVWMHSLAQGCAALQACRRSSRTRHTVQYYPHQRLSQADSCTVLQCALRQGYLQRKAPLSKQHALRHVANRCVQQVLQCYPHQTPGTASGQPLQEVRPYTRNTPLLHAHCTSHERPYAALVPGALVHTCRAPTAGLVGCSARCWGKMEHVMTDEGCMAPHTHCWSKCRTMQC
jgi:hypothetical protein